MMQLSKGSPPATTGDLNSGFGRHAKVTEARLVRTVAGTRGTEHQEATQIQVMTLEPNAEPPQANSRVTAESGQPTPRRTAVAGELLVVDADRA